MAIKLLEAAERIDIIQAINKRLREIKAGTEYTAGEGVSIDETNAISLKIDETQENAASINENGLFVEKSEPVEPGKEYTAGEGLQLVDDVFSVKLASKSKNIEISSNGILGKNPRFNCVSLFATATSSNKIEVSEYAYDTDFLKNCVFIIKNPGILNISESGEYVQIVFRDLQMSGPQFFGKTITPGENNTIFAVSANALKFYIFAVIDFSININDEPVIDGPSI